VRASELLRTTSFRLALLFLTLFGASSFAVLGFLYWQANRYVDNEVVDWLKRESTARVSAQTTSELIRNLIEHNRLDPEGQRPFALFDSAGDLINGADISLPNPPPLLDEPFYFTQVRDGRGVQFRGLAHRTASGEILLVSQNMREADRLGDLIARAMTWGWVPVTLIGLAGGAIIGFSALRRIEGVTTAVERIVKGNLSARLPRRGGDGDLDRLVQLVNGMLDDIERLMREVKGVTDDIAHDLRTPLTRLLAGLDRARRRAQDIHEYELAIDEAIVETQGLLRTFNALLRISEAEDSARRAGFKTIDLCTIAGDVAEFYEPLAEAKGVSLALQTDSDDGAKMLGDPSLLFEAVANLVDNAIKFTPSGGRIVLHTLLTKSGSGISVTDTGPGIPAEEREVVLRRFHRLERSRSTPGSGLGLSLVAAIARLHGLRFLIEDGNPGCRVTLWRDADKSVHLAIIKPPQRSLTTAPAAK
jgi:signal transduction histidine kinase